MKNFFIIALRILAGGVGLFFAISFIISINSGKNVGAMLDLLISVPTLAFAFWPRIFLKTPAPSDHYTYSNEEFAAKDHRVVRIAYQDKGGRESTRDLEIYRPRDDNYVYAYCRLRKEPRTFLVSGILGWETLTEQFSYNPLVEEWFATEGKRGSDEREEWGSWVKRKEQIGQSKPYVLKKSELLDSSEADEYDEDDGYDSWEGGFGDATDPKRLKVHLRFDYTDQKGNSTTHSVQVREFDNELYNGLMLGHCGVRRYTRTFQFNRIRNCTDLETQASIPNIKQHLNDLYEKSPERSAALLDTDYADVIKVLYFVAKADGQYRKEEKEVIASYVKKLIRDDRVTPDMIDHVVNTFSVPSLAAYRRAVGDVLKGGQVDPALLRTCCHQIVNTQKTVHPSEQAALDYLDKRMSTTPKKA